MEGIKVFYGIDSITKDCDDRCPILYDANVYIGSVYCRENCLHRGGVNDMVSQYIHCHIMEAVDQLKAKEQLGSNE